VFCEQPSHETGIEPETHVLNFIHPLIETQIESRGNIAKNEEAQKQEYIDNGKDNRRPSESEHPVNQDPCASTYFTSIGAQTITGITYASASASRTPIVGLWHIPDFACAIAYPTFSRTIAGFAIRCPTALTS
jgi:hypothetical protein